MRNLCCFFSFMKSLIFMKSCLKQYLSNYWSMETNVSSNIKNDYFLIHRQNKNMFLITVLTMGKYMRKWRFFLEIYFVLCVYAFYLHACLCTLCITGAGVRRGPWVPGTEFMNGCELPDGGWEWDLSSLQGQVPLSHLSSPSRTLFILKTCKFHTY